jgi:hypothetical protein
MRELNNSGARPRKRWPVMSIAAALLGAALLCQPSLAYAAHGGGGGGFHGGGGGGFHGGGFHGGGFHGGFGGFHGGGFHGGGFHGGGFHAGGFHGGFAGVHGGYRGHWYHGWNNGQYGWWWGDGLGWTYDPYDYGGDAYPDYGYYGYTQPNTAQTWYYCSDPSGYYPYVTQCNVGWQAVPAS